jgi:hypothetical protein
MSAQALIAQSIQREMQSGHSPTSCEFIVGDRRQRPRLHVSRRIISLLRGTA